MFFQVRHKIKLFSIFIASFFFIFAWFCGNSHFYHHEYILKVDENFRHEKSYSEKLNYSLFLLGDTGAPKKGIKNFKADPVLGVLYDYLIKQPDKNNYCIFLGDIIYPVGLPPKDHPDYPRMLKKLSVQISVVSESVSTGIFVPGNHDWERSGKVGWQYIKNLELHLRNHPYNKKKKDGVRLYPSGGNPGPALININNTSLVIIDSEWFLRRKHPKPEHNEKSVYKKIDNTLADLKKKNRNTIIISHHPWRSTGRHFGYWEVKELFWPPVIGLVGVILRATGVSHSDYNNQRYQKYIRNMEIITSRNSPLLTASGHDHSLQIQASNPPGITYYLVSGVGSGNGKTLTPVGYNENTLFAAKSMGFLIADFLKNDEIFIYIITIPRQNNLAYQMKIR
jgi:hypothetical protein